MKQTSTEDGAHQTDPCVETSRPSSVRPVISPLRRLFPTLAPRGRRGAASVTITTHRKKKARVTTLQQVSLTIRARLVRKPTPPRCRASSRWRVDIGLKLRGPLRLEKAPRLPMKMLLAE